MSLLVLFLFQTVALINILTSLFSNSGRSTSCSLPLRDQMPLPDRTKTCRLMPLLQMPLPADLRRLAV